MGPPAGYQPPPVVRQVPAPAMIPSAAPAPAVSSFGPPPSSFGQAPGFSARDDTFASLIRSDVRVSLESYQFADWLDVWINGPKWRLRPDSGKRFLLCTVRVVYGGSGRLRVTGGDFILDGGDGRVFRSQDTGRRQFDSRFRPITGDLVPGNQVSGELMFQVEWGTRPQGVGLGLGVRGEGSG